MTEDDQPNGLRIGISEHGSVFVTAIKDGEQVQFHMAPSRAQEVAAELQSAASRASKPQRRATDA